MAFPTLALISLLAADQSDLYAAVRPSLVLVVTPVSTGTAFFLGTDQDHNAWFMTNRHVVEGAAPEEIVLVRPGNQGSPLARSLVLRILVDERADLALLSVNDTRWSAVAPLLFRPEPLEKGERITCIGFPLASQDRTRLVPEPTFTRGEVVGDLEGMVETSVRVNPGNSGGPALTSDGRVVGVVTAKLTANQRSLLTPTSAVQDLAKRAGFQLPLMGGRPSRAVIAKKTMRPIPGAVRVSVAGLTLEGILLQPSSFAGASYLALTASTISAPRFGQVGLTISTAKRQWTGTGTTVLTVAGSSLIVIELPRLPGWEGAALGTFDDLRPGMEVDAVLALQCDKGFETLGARRLMISRLEQSQLITSRVARYARLDVSMPEECLAQGFAAFEGRVVGFATGSSRARGTVQISEIAGFLALMEPAVTGNLEVVDKEGQCAVMLSGRLIDPLGAARAVELRVLSEDRAVTHGVDESAALPGTIASALPAQALFDLPSISEPCAGLARSVAQVILRTDKGLRSQVVAIPRQGWRSSLPLPELWLDGKPANPAIRLFPLRARLAHGLLLGGSNAESIDVATGVVRQENTTRGEPLAWTPDGVLSWRESDNLLLLNDLPLVTACALGRPSLVASRWPRLAWHCGKTLRSSEERPPIAGFRVLAIDARGAQLGWLPWGTLALARGAEIEEVHLLQPDERPAVRFVRALEEGFLVVVGSSRLELFELRRGRAPLLRGSLTAGLAPNGNLLTDEGQLWGLTGQQLMPLEPGRAAFNVEAGRRLLPDVSSAAVLVGPDGASNDEVAALVARMPTLVSTCNQSQTPRPGDAHFIGGPTDRFMDSGPLISAGDDVRFFYSGLPPRITVGTDGIPISGNQRHARPDFFRRDLEGACRLVNRPAPSPVKETSPLRTRALPAPLPIRNVAAARWVKDRFLVVAYLRPLDSRQPTGAALWHVSDTMLRKVGEYPPLPTAEGALSVDEKGRAHFVAHFPKNPPAIFSASITSDDWEETPIPTGCCFSNLPEPAL